MILVVILNLLALTISAMLGIAFFTLMERKYLSYFQSRKGPNKTLLGGVAQPISDAVKLLAKEPNMNSKSNFAPFMLAPCANLACSLMMWVASPLVVEFHFMKMSTLFIISCMTMNTMSLMMMSWASNSNYAFIGMMRTVSQMVSYEINLILIIMTVINLTSQMDFKLMWTQQICSSFILSMAPIAMAWVMVILAETSRTPFDFSEGESELVSGFNIEYTSGSFVFLFLAEYSSILVMSIITTMMFTELKPSGAGFYLMYSMVCLLFVWTRATFPRFRYDKLMKMNWTQMLPLTTYALFLSFTYKLYCTMKS